MEGMCRVALVAAEISATTAISDPSKTMFHMLACSFIWQLRPFLDNSPFLIVWIGERQPHIAHRKILKAQMAIDIHPLSWHIDFVFTDFIVARATNFPADSSDFNESGILDTHLPHLLTPNLHHLSLEG